MTALTFENAIKDYEIQMKTYREALSKINEINLTTYWQVSKAKQLHNFVVEQAQYFNTFVKDRNDAAEYVQSVLDVLILATEILESVNTESKKQIDVGKSLIHIVEKAPGKPNYLKSGLIFTMGILIPCILSGILAIFVFPIFALGMFFLPMLFLLTNIKTHILEKNIYPQPGSLAEQIYHLRCRPLYEYSPIRFEDLSAEEMQHEYAPEFFYKQKKSTETTPAIEPSLPIPPEQRK